MDIKLFVINKNIQYDLSYLCTDEITVSTELEGIAAKLTFNIAKNTTDYDFSFVEGNNVRLIVDGFNMFNGYIFTKSRDKDNIIQVTAYDQTIYLKNKETYKFEYKTATEIINYICKVFKLKVGTLEDTKYVIETRTEENTELFDMILNAIDLTTVYTGKKFIFYDDFGELTLKSLENMKLPLMLVSDDVNLTDFSFKTDIKDDTYNKIKLYRDNEDTGKRDIYIYEDSSTQAKWGILQYYEKVPDFYTETQIEELAKQILKLKNRKKQSLSIECIATGNGETSIRGGNSILVKIDNLGEINVNAWYVVERCTHSFSENKHTISIELADI